MTWMHLRLGGLGIAWEGMGLSAETVFVCIKSPLVVYQGNTFGGTLGTSALVSQWFQIPDDLVADFSSLAGKRGVIEVSSAVLGNSNADFEFRLQTPGSDGSFTDTAKSLKKNVLWSGWKLGAFKVDFGLQVSSSIAGAHIRELLQAS